MQCSLDVALSGRQTQLALAGAARLTLFVDNLGIASDGGERDVSGSWAAAGVPPRLNPFCVCPRL